MRKLAVLVAVPIVGALLGIAPAAAQPTPDITAFCDAALTADKAANTVFAAVVLIVPASMSPTRPARPAPASSNERSLGSRSGASRSKRC